MRKLAIFVIAAACLAWTAPGACAQANWTFVPFASLTNTVGGDQPVAGLIQASDGALYGATPYGGAYYEGTVFRLTTNGVFSTLYSFTGGADGGEPVAGLIQASDGALYGTTEYGGAHYDGTIFRITTNGVFSTLYSFTGDADGGEPVANLIQAADGALYGTTEYGGADNDGTVFRMTTDGVFTSLYSFTNGFDGEDPSSPLIQAGDGALYGTAQYGGAYYDGTVFRITTNGEFTALYSFTGGADGESPAAGLIQAADGALYGTAQYGGAHYDGTVFRITTNGTLTPLYAFTGGADGEEPSAGLIQAGDGALYGTTKSGGANYDGVVFRVTTNGAFTTLHSFDNDADGDKPSAGLIQAGDGGLYSTTEDGGGYDSGTVFRITTNGVLTTLYLLSENKPTAGDVPLGGLIQASDGNFYGTAEYGGLDGYGAIFQITTNGVVTPFYSFTGGADGGYPYAGLIQAGDGNLYGTASEGGADGAGTVFQITTNGALTSLYSFTNGVDGAYPTAGLIQAGDGGLYGTAPDGGSNGYGTVFRISSGGVFTPLYSFKGGADGGDPQAGLIQAGDGNLYGTAEENGANGFGTVFQITTNGVLTPLYSFTGVEDGGYPQAGLIQASDGNLYGTTEEKGADGFGTVFQITTTGVLTPLYSFTGGTDGAYPLAGLIQTSSGDLYGTTEKGGAFGFGTAFQITTNGVLTPLYGFADGVDGGYPCAGVIQAADGNLYGTTKAGGAYGNGAVFQLLSPTSPPVFTAQPTNETARLGGSATFSAGVTGPGPLAYQWEFNGTNLAAATNATLTLWNLSPTEAGSYSVQVVNSNATVVSAVATLTVTPGSVVVQTNCGPQTVTNWVSLVYAGAWPAASVALSFSNSTNGLFSSQPGLDASGDLLFTPASGASGLAQVTVVLQTNGAPETTNEFAIEVMAVPMRPGDAIIANRSFYLGNGEIMLFRASDLSQNLLNTVLKDSYAVAFDTNRDILVADYQTGHDTNFDGGIFKINRDSLALTKVSQDTNFVTPFGVVVEPDNQILVADLDANDSGTVFRVDPATGQATLLSTGGSFYWLGGIAIALATNTGTETIYLTDHGDGMGDIPPAVYAVDPATGAQTVISANGYLVNPDGLVADPSGRLIVADSMAQALILINPANGLQTLLTTNAPFVFPTHVAIDSLSGDYLVTDGDPTPSTSANALGVGALWRVDKSTFSVTNLGSAGFFEQPRGIISQP